MDFQKPLNEAIKAVNALQDALADSRRTIKQLPNALSSAEKQHAEHVAKLQEAFEKKQAEIAKQIHETAAALEHAKKAEAKALHSQQEAAALHSVNVAKEKALNDRELTLNKQIEENKAKEAELQSKLNRIAELKTAI
jgi:uncharacterized protein YukE